MSWIKTVTPDEAEGKLKEIYDEAKAKFGEVLNLVTIQSLPTAAFEADCDRQPQFFLKEAL